MNAEARTPPIEFGQLFRASFLLQPDQRGGQVLGQPRSNLCLVYPQHCGKHGGLPIPATLVNDGCALDGTSHTAPVWPKRRLAGSRLPFFDSPPIEQHANTLMPGMAIGEGQLEDAQIGHRQSLAKPNCHDGFVIWTGNFDHPPIRKRNFVGGYPQTATIGQFLPSRINSPFFPVAEAGATNPLECEICVHEPNFAVRE